MNVLVLTQYFSPEACAAANRTVAVCRGLHEAGHRVRVLTAFPSFPNGTIPKRYRGKLYRRERLSRIEVFRLWTYASPRLRARDRMLNWFSTALSMCAALPLCTKTDAVYVSSPPITLALPALFLSYLLRVPLIVDVRDAYPDVAVKMGVWKKGSLVTRLVSGAARALYRRASAIACVTQTVRDEVVARAGNAAARKTFVAPNGFDPVEAQREPVYRRSYGEFVAAFAGNIGVATGVDVIVDAAALLRGRAVQFVLAGGGAALPALRERILNEGLDNVSLLGSMDREAALAVLRDADVCLVPLRRGIHDSLPTKIFDSLYVGCPVLVSGDGEAGAFIERSRGGWSVAAEDPAALADQIERCAAMPAECREAGSRGGSYVRDRCGREEAVARIVSAIERSCAAAANSSHVYL
ncbi:MAG TPA: glycosyltransferase family 4 protein [Candidatus Baltobacteraceae bacterium]|nr:glycosyltransferase family 4 protein [Candidatus Baltobacteraceae bacterium]